MASFSKIVRFDEMRSIDFASIDVSYLPIGTPFDHIVRLFKIVNTSDSGVFISFDGSLDNDYIPANGFSLYDFTTNQFPGTEFTMSKGTVTYVKYDIAPTTGSVFVVCVYGKGE